MKKPRLAHWVTKGHIAQWTDKNRATELITKHDQVHVTQAEETRTVSSPNCEQDSYFKPLSLKQFVV